MVGGLSVCGTMERGFRERGLRALVYAGGVLLAGVFGMLLCFCVSVFCFLFFLVRG